MNGDERGELDRKLDAALAEYANIEPPAGMEQRILARVREAGGSGRIHWWRWVAAAVPALAGLLAVFVYRDLPPVAPPSPVALSVPQAPALVRPVVKRVSRPRPAPLPKREVFPTPTPLSPEERALLQLVAQSPEKAREVLTPVEPKPIEPIVIEPLNNGG
ncbi:MAG: hypothetical protein LLG20_04015 [Acidobacteriales bacterium]|nr:hypothetical protein [Terriglobales bacterium]